MSMRFVSFARAKFAPKNLILVGQCLAHEIPKETNVQVKVQEFDSFLNMYFCKFEHFIAHDPNEICKHGDIVLLRRLSEKTKTHINHNIIKVLYPFGDIVDPVTGKKCVASTYRDDLKRKKDAYGIAEDGTGGFDYDSAPDRGWQKDKKDFTHRVAYVQYHVFPPGHEKHDDKAAS